MITPGTPSGAPGRRGSPRPARGPRSEGAPLAARADRGAGGAGDLDDAPWAPPQGEPEPTNGDGATTASPVDGPRVTPMVDDSAESAGSVTSVPQTGPLPGVDTS